MATLGFCMFIIGACGFDSAHRLVPALLVVSGMALLLAAGRRSEWTR